MINLDANTLLTWSILSAIGYLIGGPAGAAVGLGCAVGVSILAGL